MSPSPTTNKKTAKSKKEEKAQIIFAQLAMLWPHAHCELAHNTPFQLVLAVLLSAQATDVSVNKALAPLLARMPQFSAADLVHMGEKKFLGVIRSIGLAPTKAKNSVSMAAKLLSEFAGEVPLTREQLETLPGVGRKTANVVLNVLCGEPTMAVDTHVARVSQRLGLVKPTTDRVKIEHELLALVPSEHAVVAHHLLIFHGRYLCTARAPKCATCPLLPLCPQVGVL